MEPQQSYLELIRRPWVNLLDHSRGVLRAAVVGLLALAQASGWAGFDLELRRGQDVYTSAFTVAGRFRVRGEFHSTYTLGEPGPCVNYSVAPVLWTPQEAADMAEVLLATFAGWPDRFDASLP